MKAKVIPVPPELDTPEVHEELAAHRRAVCHFIAHHEQLREQYPLQWVALWVDEADVPTVEVDNSIDGLVRKARGKSLPLKRSYIRYMATEPRYYA